MSSEQDGAGAQTALPRRSQLSRSAAKRIKIAVLGVVVLLFLGGAAWQISLWTMPVDSYTVVEVTPGPDGLAGDGKVIASYSSTDAGFATRLRQSINNDPAVPSGFFSYPFVDGPVCTGYPYPPSHFPPYGTQYIMTFRSGGRVIETVAGSTNNCGFALVKCGIVSVWKEDVQPIPLPDLSQILFADSIAIT